jgi:hypothetical protein
MATAGPQRLATTADQIVPPLAAQPLALLTTAPDPDLPVADQPATAAAPQRRRGPSPWFLQAEAALYRSTLTLATADSITSPWLQARRQSETALEAWSSTLSFGYQHPAGWYARAGLGYTQWASRFEIRQEDSRIDTVQGITTIFVTPAGDSTFVEGPIARYERINYYKRTYNYLRHWDLPLLLGYQFRQGPWRFGLEGGLRFNIRQEASGEILDQDLNVAPWAEAGQLRTSVGVSWQAGAQAGYQLTPRLQLQVGAHFRYYSQSFSEEGAALTSRRQLLGGNVGVRWRW